MDINKKYELLVNNTYKAKDKIFSLATGTLALSITFRGSIIGDHPIDLWHLKLSWIALSITCFSHIFDLFWLNAIDAHFLSSDLTTKIFDPLLKRENDDNKKWGTNSTLIKDAYEQQRQKNLEKAQKLMPESLKVQALFIASFIIGFSSMVIFAIKNLK
jgi:hypothetical protein